MGCLWQTWGVLPCSYLPQATTYNLKNCPTFSNIWTHRWISWTVLDKRKKRKFLSSRNPRPWLARTLMKCALIRKWTWSNFTKSWGTSEGSASSWRRWTSNWWSEQKNCRTLLTKRPLHIRSTMTTHPSLTKNSQRRPRPRQEASQRLRKVGSYSRTK